MNKILITREDTSMEIYARIAKAEACKYDCSVDIDFSGNNRDIRLVGDKSYVPYIIEEMRNMLKKAC